MDLDQFEQKRIIRDGVAEEIATWLESLVHRVENVETELLDQQSSHNHAAHSLAQFHERKRELETIENTIDIVFRRHGRADLDMLVHFANELRAELVSLSRDLGKMLSPEEEEAP